jgi:hypothetical protein
MHLFSVRDVMFKHSRLTQVEDDAPFIGAESVNRILEKAKMAGDVPGQGGKGQGTGKHHEECERSDCIHRLVK